MSRHHLVAPVVATALLAAAAPALAHDGHRHGDDVLRAGLAGSTKPTVIFGVQPGGRDWVVRRGAVRLKAGPAWRPPISRPWRSRTRLRCGMPVPRG